ncbi:MAG: hypothetical protein HY257_12650 [Chloroflexi bacterium]|nr:hypothetical protein [Chloroflexota bacterium]
MLLQGELWKEWFLGIFNIYHYFRPLVYLSVFVDYLMWNLSPVGFHLSKILLHLLASFQVFVLSALVTRRRLVALVVSALFAIMPVNVSAVAWMTARGDMLVGIFCFTSLIFFILSRERKSNYLLSLAVLMYCLALLAKESALMIPLAILVYDIVWSYRASFNFGQLAKRFAPFILVTVIYLLFRIFVLGTFGFHGAQASSSDVFNWGVGALDNAIEPMNLGLSSRVIALLAGVVIFSVAMLRGQRILIFGLTWIPITFIPTISSIAGPTQRSFYSPAFGIALVLTFVLFQIQSHSNKLIAISGALLLIILSISYSLATSTRNQSFHRAGEITQAIVQQVKSIAPIVRPETRMIFVGVPDRLPDGTLVFLVGFNSAIQLVYNNPTIEAFNFSEFPLWLDDPDRTLLFTIDHRKVTERQDLMLLLRKRKQCEASENLALSWDFSTDAQGWEAWNALSEFQFRDGSLATHALANDSSMGSPPMNIPSLVIGDVEITLAIRADQPDVHGKLYWLGALQQDFSPDLKETFSVPADGNFHTLRLDLAKNGKLLIQDRITQLRLDPVDVPADISLRSIRVFTHCADMK